MKRFGQLGYRAGTLLNQSLVGEGPFITVVKENKG